MPALMRKISTITEKGQVTIPKTVRDALGLGYGGRIAFNIDESRHVSIERVDDEDEADPVIDHFLTFLAKDMQENPQHIAEFPEALRGRMQALVKGMEVNLDDAIDGEVDL
ncbi:type II toxin-antitoxin system PrlF family antitoxin [Allorhizobium terrae]|uniref:AbrB family transcriptional regulator n=1 Tax=Allorhizobium terrae TaxID=1848972 RepID=A0A4S4A5S3_9HYPH|nr:type II toxin-antitoxin system PrlF family antitoxin [Allorhizobium terrae]THF53862.1 AbrB family transcriptional regulator [Allorhizobium terrae]